MAHLLCSTLPSQRGLVAQLGKAWEPLQGNNLIWDVPFGVHTLLLSRKWNGLVAWSAVCHADRAINCAFRDQSVRLPTRLRQAQERTAQQQLLAMQSVVATNKRPDVRQICSDKRRPLMKPCLLMQPWPYPRNSNSCCPAPWVCQRERGPGEPRAPMRGACQMRTGDRPRSKNEETMALVPGL